MYGVHKLKHMHSHVAEDLLKTSVECKQFASKGRFVSLGGKGLQLAVSV